MKLPTALILPTVLLLAIPRSTPAEPSPGDDSTPTITEVQIDPGQRIGPLKIGDTQDRALELFPLKKDVDQQWEDACGTTIDWVDSRNPNGRGDLAIRFKKGKVFQIESSTTRFHTAEGITTFDSPSTVRDYYKDMRAYTLLTQPSSTLGDRPLVFWVDKKRGIAFTLAFYPQQRKRYIYKIIVFVPNKEFCPEEETMHSPKWQEIRPYSLEPPADLSPERAY